MSFSRHIMKRSGRAGSPEVCWTGVGWLLVGLLASIAAGAYLADADFNSDGLVDFRDFSKLAKYWLQDEASVDIAPAPLGDHIVNFKDLAVLAEHWLEEDIVSIQWLGHASVKIWAADAVIYVDPRNLSISPHDATLVLVTHNHSDHYVPADIAKVSGPTTKLIAAASVVTAYGSGQAITPGQTIQMGNIAITGVAAYNLVKTNHPKASNWLGFVVAIGGRRIYIAGDTDLIPEMQTLGKIDAAFLPISPAYTMGPDEAAQATMYIMPQLAVPYHWGTSTLGDAQRFARKAYCNVKIMSTGETISSQDWNREFSLAAHWKLDEAAGTTADDSADSKDGTVNGNPIWQSTGGKLNGCLQLDGVGDYVSTAFILNPADGPFSALVWVKAGAEGQAILSQASGTGTGRDWLAADVEDGRLMTQLRPAGRQGSSMLSEFIINDGNWHHVGLVWDGSRRYLYADGNEVASDNKPQGALESANGGLYLGAGSSLDPNTFWSGLLDDVRIYARALSGVAVSQLTSLLLAQAQPDVTLERAIEVQEAYTDFLLSIEGVAGVAVGYDDNYRVVIKVFVTRPDIAGIPEQLDGVPVQVVVTEEFYAVRESQAAFTAYAADPVDRTARFARPVPIGVSTGHIGVTAGTIACRLKDEAGNVYALSNNHVYAKSNTATIGDNVLQPGPYDGGQNPDDAIGTLFDFEPINFSLLASNTIDAAIARCTLDTLDNATPPDGYGKPRSKTALARLHQKVQKYGRTTGLTEGAIDAVNAVVIVLYRNPDFDPDTGTGGPPFRVARFDNQILAKPGAEFVQPGDSGSLVITPAKKAVGLLFAGSSSYAVCNPIDPVLQRFAVTIDDQ